jgi:hypothetical protein
MNTNAEILVRTAVGIEAPSTARKRAGGTLASGTDAPQATRPKSKDLATLRLTVLSLPNMFAAGAGHGIGWPLLG